MPSIGVQLSSSPRPTYGNGNGGYQNGAPRPANGQYRPPANAAPNGATTEAHRPGVTPPVNGDASRVTITIYETDDVLADEDRKSVV